MADDAGGAGQEVQGKDPVLSFTSRSDPRPDDRDDEAASVFKASQRHSRGSRQPLSLERRRLPEWIEATEKITRPTCSPMLHRTPW